MSPRLPPSCWELTVEHLVSVCGGPEAPSSGGMSAGPRGISIPVLLASEARVALFVKHRHTLAVALVAE